LKYIQSAGVIHRDLKPSNILVDENHDLKICDFGLARVWEPQMTGYVTTRFYRAPEIMTSWQTYGMEVDVWSCACVFAEMLDGKILFPGESDMSQLSLMAELLGKDGIETGIMSYVSIRMSPVITPSLLEIRFSYCLLFRACGQTKAGLTAEHYHCTKGSEK
jgi:p38 MAP kinase